VASPGVLDVTAYEMRKPKRLSSTCPSVQVRVRMRGKVKVKVKVGVRVSKYVGK